MALGILIVVCSLLLLLLIIPASLNTKVFATHSVSAIPGGGPYNTSQAVTLSSTEPTATIYYTTDGSQPTNSSSIYSTPIIISTNTTLKFMAIDPSDNHTSSTVTEVYEIDLSSPLVISTSPNENETRVDPLSIFSINATFS